METKQSREIIKPKFYKMYFGGLTFIIALNLFQIFGVAIMENVFNPVVISAQLTATALMVLAFINYFYKTIRIDEQIFVYKGLTFTREVTCEEIKKIVLERKSTGKKRVYNLVFEGKLALSIKDAQNYNKEDIERLLLFIEGFGKVTSENIEDVLSQI